MKYKKGFIFICLIICLFSIASVCASDINETSVASNDQSNDMLEIESQDELSHNNAEETIGISEDATDDGSDMSDSPSPVSTKVTVKNVKGYENKKVKVTAFVKDSTGKKVKKGTVIFKFKGKNYKVKLTNGKAVKTIKIPKTNNRGIYYKYPKGKVTEIYEDVDYNGKVSFLGDGNYRSSSSKFKVTSMKKSKTKKYTPTYMSEKTGKTTHKKPKTVTKKKTTTKKKISVKKFKSKSKYSWKIKTSTWNKMKNQAKKNYNFFRKHGSAHPGYSNALKVTVTKAGHKYKGIAYAVKNSKGIRCEVRGVKTGVYISNWNDYYV